MDTKIPNFRRCVIQNFPFIEQDFDALTDYGLLSKIVEYLNTVINQTNTTTENMEALQNAFNTLKNYVDHYFDNLNVQTEINNKLDQMATDGTLETIIGQYVDNVIMPTINGQTARIDQLENAVQSVANGSPLVASSTDDMTDTTKTYVNTTDGKWYYYDGEEWTVGGTYQSSGIADNSINILMLDNALQANFNMSFGSAYTPASTQAGYYKVVAATQKVGFESNAQYASYNLDLEVGKVYCFNGFNYGSLVGLIVADAEDNVIFSTKGETSYDTVGCSCIFNVKQTGLKAYISPVVTGGVIKAMTMLREISSIDNNLKINSTLTEVTTFNSYTLNNSTSVGSQVTFGSANNYTTKAYAVSKGVTYKVTGKNYGVNRSVVFTDLNQITRYFNNNSDSEAYSYEYTAEYDGFVYVTNYSNASLLNGAVSVVAANITLEADSPLKNKKIVYDGDSICESRLSGNAANGGAYSKIISDIVGGSYVNQAVGGGTLSYVASQDAHSVVNNLSNLPNDGDIYCFEGGLNDWWTNRQLGTFDATDYTSDPDVSTITGAMEAIFRYALTNFLGKPVVFVIIHKIANPFGTHAGVTFPQVRERMLAVCEKYGIPCFDAWKDSGLNGMITAQSNAYLNANSSQTADGTHPNKECYEKFYVPQLLDLLESIIQK